MPEPQPETDWRARWLPVLFRIGIALAPLAALLLLLGEGGGPLRAAAVLGILSSVLIALSVVLRNDVETVRVQIEEMVLDEADAVRDDMRQDVVAVARKLHGRLREELADLAEQVEELRAQVGGAGAAIPDLSREAAEITSRVVPRTDRPGWSQDPDDEPTDSRWASGRSRVAGGEPAGHGAGRPGRYGQAPLVTPAAAIEPPRPERQQAVVGAGRGNDSDDEGHWSGGSVGAGRWGGSGGGLSGRAGRRRAADPDEVPAAGEWGSPGDGADPWADLRGDARPAGVEPLHEAVAVPTARAEVRFDSGFGDNAHGRYREPVPARHDPGPLDPGWRGGGYR